jgi:hypothetical protein
MREIGIVVDDVAKCHNKDDSKNKGSQSIIFLDDNQTIDLRVRAALMTFIVCKPTIEECKTLPVVDVAIENWNPQKHFDDNHALVANIATDPVEMKINMAVTFVNDVSVKPDDTTEVIEDNITVDASDIEDDNCMVMKIASTFCHDTTNSTLHKNDDLFFDTFENNSFEASVNKSSFSVSREETKPLGNHTVEEQTNKNTLLHDLTETISEVHKTNHPGEKHEQTFVVYRTATLLVPTACLSLAATGNAFSNDHNQFHDAIDHVIDDTLYYFDATDEELPPKPGRAMHLTIDYQIIGKGEQGRQHQICFTRAEHVESLLADMDYDQLTGHSECFDTVACVITTVEKIQRLETLQPKLA